jgi:DNA-binding transcriptional regulator LsrR (DeoR family)
MFDVRLITKIAKLYYLDNLNQAKISKKLNISTSAVSRSLRKAVESKIVDIRIISSFDNECDIERKLEEKYHIRECVVVSAVKKPESICREMATVMRNVLERVIEEGDHIGVSWGETDKLLVENLQFRKRINVKVVPIIGGLGEFETGVNTNSIARTLAERIGGSSYLINSPAVLDSREIREIIEKDSNTSRIKQLWERLTTVIVGAGDLSEESSAHKYSILRDDELDYLKSLGVVGEVNLNYINSLGESVANKIDQRLLRMSLSSLKKIKNLILVAFGRRKVRVIMGALRGGFVDVLITDEMTAREIMRSSDRRTAE